jgi:hypothetical protein
MRAALDCVRALLETTGGRHLRIVPRHSKEARRLKPQCAPRPPTGCAAGDSCSQGTERTYRAMRRVRHAGLCPLPVEFRILNVLAPTESGLDGELAPRDTAPVRSATNEEWRDLRRSELAAAAERERLSAIGRSTQGGSCKSYSTREPRTSTALTAAVRCRTRHCRGDRRQRGPGHL